MFYLTQMLGKPVVDAAGEVIGQISDVAIATGEVFPRVTSLAFLGPTKTPFMLSWRKYVASLEDDRVVLNDGRSGLRFSYLQPDEILLARDLLNRQIVDTQGMKVVRVNDLKLSESRNQLRLLGAEVGVRGILRGIHPALERAASRATRLFGRELSENLIAWNYMDLLERDLSHVRLSVTHKRLHELHPADVADVLEQLGPTQRARVFEHLDNTQAALTVAELEDEIQADVIDDLGSQRASDILEMMDPDDAADVIGDLPYDKAEALLRLMGVQEARAIRSLLGYREKTAGGIMTPEVTTVTDDMTVQQVIEYLRTGAAEHESIYYIYVVEGARRLEGVVSLRDLVMSEPATPVADLVNREVITVGPDDDQELVAETMSKYDLLAIPVVDETGKLLGIVTVDDALDVMEEESAEDLALATGRRRRDELAGFWHRVSHNGWLLVWGGTFVLAAAAESAVGPRLGRGFLMGAVLASPMILRVAEDVAVNVMVRVIGPEPDDRAPGLGRRLAADAGAGLLLGLAIGLVWALVTGLLANAPVLGMRVYEVAAIVGAAYALAVVLVTLAGTLAGMVVERLIRADKRASQVGLAVLLMVFGEIVFLGLAAAVAYIVRPIIGA